MKQNRFCFFLHLLLVLASSTQVYAGPGNNPPKDRPNNAHDGNGQGSGNGSGKVPEPADRNNNHGMINNGGNYNNGRNAQVPFDGGMGLLVAAGVGLGIKRAYDKRKNRRHAINKPDANVVGE